MKRNVGGIDQVLRIAAGVALLVWVLAFAGPWWAWFGVVPLATGLFGFCPVYPLLGLNSCPLPKRG